MGYQVTFVPTEEAMNKYKPWKEERPKDSMVDTFKYELISYCMKKREESPSNITKQLGFLLRCLSQAVETEEKNNAYFRWKDDNDHELWYCGWEFSRDSVHDRDSLIHDMIESLFILTDLVETPDYFENRENFFTKYKDIEEDIDGFIENIQSLTIHDIINDLDEFKKKSDDEDE